MEIQAIKQLRQQLEEQVSQLIENGMHPYNAYLNAYQTAESIKSFLLSMNRKEWRRVWKLSYYFNKKAGLALDMSEKKSRLYPVKNPSISHMH